MYSIKYLIEFALEEDIGPGDITTDSVVGPEDLGKGRIVAKEPMVLAGMDIARQVFAAVDPDVVFEPAFADGESVTTGQTVLNVRGRLRSLLRGERVALNFLQRLSGIATLSRTYVEKLGNRKIRLADTRKTTPGWRVLEKYAVRVGGADNHRTGLYDGVLIKDNHIAACGGIGKAIMQVRERVSHLVKIEVEVEDLQGVREALDAGADVIMLDNMETARIREAVGMIQGRALVEVSGNVTLERLPELGATGVDIISCGAITHSARSMDLSMKIQAV